MRSIRDCNVVVVGGAGFLGSHLVEHLLQDRGCRVLVIDNLIAGRREFVHPDAEFEHHDITGSETHLQRLFQHFGARFVFNYAADPYIPVSFERPLHVFNSTAFGALKVINAAHEAGCCGILQVSSAEIYGMGSEDREQSGSHPIDETGLVCPHSSYGAAKAAIDAMVQVRWREAKVPCIALRQFNCVGERETHPYVIPEIISQLAAIRHKRDTGRSGVIDSGFAVIKLGNNSFRDFMYAGDAVRIAVELLERGQFGEVYNLGSESGIKIYDLARLIGKLMGFADVVVELDQARVRPWEIWHLQSDNSKIAEHTDNPLKWNMTPLEESLKRTIAWFNNNGRKWPWER